MTRLAFIDTETESDIDIKGAGTIRYAERCRPLSVHWISPGSSIVHRYETHHGPVPNPLNLLLLDDSITWVAHHSMFDRWVIVEGLGYYNLADPKRWVCTSALAKYAGLPGKLAQLGARLHLTERKDDYGDQEGINLFTKAYSPAYRTPAQEPAKWQKFMKYGDQDTRTCKRAYEALGRRVLTGRPAEHWKAREHKVFLWDQRVNDLGIPVDPTMLDSALAMVAQSTPAMEAEMARLTQGYVRTLGSPKLKEYLGSEFLLALPNLRKETLIDALAEGELEPEAEAIIRLRLNGHKTSLAKFGRMDSMMSTDCRVRGAFSYHGAHTGRWAGQGFQPQNLTRPSEDLDPVEVADAVALCRGSPEALMEVFQGVPIYDLLTSAIRGAIQARRGKVLVIADYNQIESRKLAWMSGCARKLEAFVRHDAGLSNLDPYEVTALDVLGDPGRRFEGKTMDLGLGFGMGDVRFAAVSGKPWLQARDMVKAWRTKYVEIPTLWDTVGQMFHEALGVKSWSKFDTDPARGRLAKLGVSVERAGTTAIAYLPSGKPLFYHALRHATFRESLAAAAKYNRSEQVLQSFERVFHRSYDPDLDGGVRDTRQLAFTSNYGSQRLIHGGFTVENFVQGSSREVMVTHALEIEEERDIVPVLHSHDELVFEVPEREAPAFAEYLEDKLGQTPLETPGLPLKAEVKISPRYTK